MNFRTILFCSILASVMILTGYFFERLKVSVNFIIEKSMIEPGYDTWSNSARSEFIVSNRRLLPYDYFHSHLDFDFLFMLTTKQLMQFKWWVTGIGLLIFSIMNAMALIAFCSKREAITWILFMYAVIILLSCFFILLGYLLSLHQEAYQITRKILNAGQSGIPSILVYLVKKFS